MAKDKNPADSLDNVRHSLAHLLAAAVMELWPDTKRTIGPAIENGFYFDFEFSKPISEDALPKIEGKMREILPTWRTFERHMLSADAAKKEYPGNEYKHELIDEFTKDGEQVSFYKSGDYWDLCRGGHVENMQTIDPDSFKLDRLAGAYWRGKESNTMLTRVYGLAFHDKKELDEYLKMMEEAKKRDHKKLGPDLDLFVFSDLVGPGLPLWTPKGTILRNLLSDFVWELRRAKNYQRVEIPHITKKELYETSGHWDKYKDDLFKIRTREDHEFAMKPMNCPHHAQIYARRQWSYRDLPQRYENTTMCYRDEQTGELSGLSRVRAFTQDDAHVFCRSSQVKQEFLKIWDIIHDFYGTFGFQLKVRLSLHDPEHPENYLGGEDRWKQAEKDLREIAAEKNADAFEAPGEAAFYGPKLDFLAKDSIGREWQVATIQLDMNMPERFDLTCINEEGGKERVVMVHAAIMGSIERFLSILIEHMAGAFPLWLAPVQVTVIPVSEKHADYAEKVAAALRATNVRVEISSPNESLGKRIRFSEIQKIPYSLIVGDQEEKAGTVSVRRYKGGEEEKDVKLDSLLERISSEINDKVV